MGEVLRELLASAKIISVIIAKTPRRAEVIVKVAGSSSRLDASARRGKRETDARRKRGLSFEHRSSLAPSVPFGGFLPVEEWLGLSGKSCPCDNDDGDDVGAGERRRLTKVDSGRAQAEAELPKFPAATGYISIEFHPPAAALRRTRRQCRGCSRDDVRRRRVYTVELPAYGGPAYVCQQAGRKRMRLQRGARAACGT